ncbi:uncharacterized protein BCR38DRAFT_318750, partial [Pseudomassariella vexata]
RRVSRDGFETWVEPKQLRSTSNKPNWMKKRADRPGRRWDHLRTNEPPIIGTGYRPPHVDQRARYRDYIASTALPRSRDDQSVIISNERLDEMLHLGDGKSTRQLPELESQNPPETHPVASRLRKFVLHHFLTPLLFRLVVMATSIGALGMAIQIYEDEFHSPSKSQQEVSQAIVAISVDAIAIPYIAYMMYDEVRGAPIGLRSPFAKMTLILLDTFFITFKAIGTALAFEALIYRTYEDAALKRSLARSMASLMLVGLVSWIANFIISLFRLVERL